jgi:DNA-binding CsgD family transcriptional regulator/tetratricopeptide (TPR) repeat protein
MEMAPQPILVGKRASVSDAKLAYFEGDFERCLEICTDIRVGSLGTASEVALLTARAYLRTGRPNEAQRAIVDSLETHTTLDASLTAQMLVGSARIRQDDADTGIAILVDAATRSEGAHFAVCSEIAFATALGHWAKRELDIAETYLHKVDPLSDIIHARALELLAWCHTARRDYRRSAEAFRATLLRLDDCKAHDRAITATAISTLAIYAAELFDRELARFVSARAVAIDWASGLTAQHHITLAHQALFSEFAGDTVAAYQFAAQAREAAPTAAFEVLGWGLSSTLARNAGEMHSATMYAKRADQLLSTFDTRSLLGEERFALLVVAENCAHFDIGRASELCARYYGLAPVDKVHAASGDVRTTADEAFISGILEQARGERERALTRYRTAFELFRDIGYVRRAVIAGHALLKVADDSLVRAYVASNSCGTSNFVAMSLAAGNTEGVARLERHPVVASLPPAQRDVVMQVCLGKTNREIARMRNVGEQTIKNMLTKHIFRAFGVSSRAALVSSCLRGRVAGE